MRNQDSQKKLQWNEKAIADMAAWVVVRNGRRHPAWKTQKIDKHRTQDEGDQADRRGQCYWSGPMRTYAEIGIRMLTLTAVNSLPG